MGDKTGIGWTIGKDGKAGATWNPIRSATGKGWHCVKVSDECDNCYAEGLNMFRGSKLPYTKGADAVSLDIDTLLDPLRWQRGRKIFPCSMTDWFLADVPMQWNLAMLGVTMLAQRHLFEFLTKRADRQQRFFEKLRGMTYRETIDTCLGALVDLAPDAKRYIHKQPAPGSASFRNAWIGVSVGNTKALWRVEKLVETPVPVRWLSIEPMIDMSIDFTPWLKLRPCPLHWAVIGGESGAYARGFDVGAGYRIVQAFKQAQVPVFVKQLGSRPFNFGAIASRGLRDVSGKGDDPKEWPEAMRVQEFPHFVHV